MVVTAKQTTKHMTLGQTAKLSPLAIGRTRFIKKLGEYGFLMADGSPKQKFIDRGYFVYTLKKVRNGNGKLVKVVPVVLVTVKGLHYLNRYFLQTLKQSAHGNQN